MYKDVSGKIYTLDQVLATLGFFKCEDGYISSDEEECVKVSNNKRKKSNKESTIKIPECIKCVDSEQVNMIANSKPDEQYVYVLKLTDGKFYVGYTINLENKLVAQFNGKGCKYTKKYRALLLVNLYKGYKEEALSEIIMMFKTHGQDNVGGRVSITTTARHVVDY